MSHISLECLLENICVGICYLQNCLASLVPLHVVFFSLLRTVKNSIWKWKKKMFYCHANEQNIVSLCKQMKKKKIENDFFSPLNKRIFFFTQLNKWKKH